MKKIHHLIGGMVLTAILLVTSCEMGYTPEEKLESPAPSALSRTLGTTADMGVMLHAYMWRFQDIAANMEAIANAGYTSIQVSPIQPTKENNSDWWLLYQPTDYAIGNYQLGSKADFQYLCQVADDYGISIIVDAVLNQVADNGNSGWSDAVADYLKNYDYYHNLGPCDDYGDRHSVTQENLGNGPDLNTQYRVVQDFHLNFLNECVDAGADGFRFDAAKHIETNQGEDAGKPWAGDYWDYILGNLKNKESLYLFGEVLPDSGDNDQVYQTYYDITAHGYVDIVYEAVRDKNLVNGQTIKHNKWTNGGMDPRKALVYVENHDNFEHGDTTSRSYEERKMATAYIIARDNITPRVFDRPLYNGIDEELWKDPDITAINHFHNAMFGLGEYLRFPQEDLVIIDRGTQGTAVINVGEGTNIYTETNLKAGTYSNKGTKSASVTSSGGYLSGYIPGWSILVFYNKSEPLDPPGTPTNLTVTEETASSISLTWSASEYADGYKVFASDSPQGIYQEKGTTTATQLTVADLAKNTTYYFKVLAWNSAGSSALSQHTQGTTTNTLVSNYPTMNLRGTFNSWGTAPMTLVSDYLWSVDIEVTQAIRYKMDAYGDWSVNWGDNNGDGYGDQGGDDILYTPGKAGIYRVTFNDSTLGYTISYEGEGENLPPETPTGLEAEVISSTQIDLSWNQVETADSYEVYRDGTLVGATTQTTMSLTGLTPATAYSLSVLALNSYGSSSLSEAVVATTQNGENNTTTTIRIHYDVGMGNNITIRGSEYPLSWTSGVPAEWTSGNVWVYTTEEIPQGALIEFKPLINDSSWASGGNFQGTGGETIDIYPQF